MRLQQIMQPFRDVYENTMNALLKVPLKKLYKHTSGPCLLRSMVKNTLMVGRMVLRTKINIKQYYEIQK